MSALPRDEIIRGYVEEVKTYIPSLLKDIETLRQKPEQYKTVEEIHRLVHTIKGASSMVGISGLSHIAYQMEDALSEILAGKIPLSSKALDVMSFTVGQFKKYCTGLSDGGVKVREIVKETLLAFRRLKGLPTKDDEAALASLLENIPEYEGRSPVKVSALAFNNIAPELLESFYKEAEEPLSNLHRLLGDLEDRVNKDMPMSEELRELIRQIRRAVHTMKGAAAVIGFSSFANWAREAEYFLDWQCDEASEITPDIVELLKTSAQMIEHLIANPEEAQSEAAATLIETYRELRQKHDPVPLNRRSEPASEIIETEISEAEPETSDTEILPELLESFYDEAKEHIEDLDRALNSLESQIVKPTELSDSLKETIRGIRRSVHTVKGAAAVIGLSNISSYAHQFEDFLDWLYEKARTITPDIVGALLDSADLLERIIANPKNSQTYKVQSLKAVYRKFIEDSSDDSSEHAQPIPIKKTNLLSKTYVGDEQKKSTEEMLSPHILFKDESDEEDDVSAEPAPRSGKTMRVAMEKIDELVNLTGELFIALSAFDQKMDFLTEAIAELELSRNRLKDIARDMEVGYEVKALERRLEKVGEMRTADFDGEIETFEDFDALELDRYSELSLIIRMLNESAIDIGAIYSHLSNLFTDFDGHINRQRVLLSELQDKMMRVRMVPMSLITNKLRRIVREVAGKLGKKIRLVISGADIELDRLIWEKITDPLMHLLRNAADHGIEAPALRQTMGKPSVATIRLSASREGNQVVIRVSDDGSGLNYDMIRETVRKAGLSDNVDNLSEEELTSFIFRPGFSTRSKISEVSGRGVGMDVVRENVQELKGTIQVSSWKGKGTQFTIRIPLTLAAVRALLLSNGGQIFAIALNEIGEIMRIDPDNIISGPEDAVNIGGKVLPLYYLSRQLKMSGSEARNPHEHPIVLVVHAGGRKAALIIDAIVGQREIVIKSTGSHLRHVKGISGATIMGDGSVVPILNLEELIWGKSLAPETMPILSSGINPDKPLEVLVVDDSVSIRQVVSRLIEDQGWKAHTAKDGLDALERLREIHPDIIVLDIEMPRMNGYELLSAIKADPAYCNIPVVMLTSRTTAKHREKALALGAKGFTVKPYNKDEFINIILKLTDR